MKTVTFTDEEIKVLESFLWCNPCEAGCAFEEMQKSNKDCDECKF